MQVSLRTVVSKVSSSDNPPWVKVYVVMDVLSQLLHTSGHSQQADIRANGSFNPALCRFCNTFLPKVSSENALSAVVFMQAESPPTHRLSPL